MNKAQSLSNVLAFKEYILLLEGEMKTNVCERCNRRSVGEKERNNKNHKCLHKFNYTSEKSNRMVSPNVNVTGQKRKNSDTLTQAKECKMITVCKSIYTAQRGETVARRTSLHLL